MELDAQTGLKEYRQKELSPKQQANKMPIPTLLQQFTYETYKKLGERQVNLGTMPLRELHEYYTGLRRYMPKEIGEIQVVMLEMRYRENKYIYGRGKIDEFQEDPSQRKYSKMKVLTDWCKSLGNPFYACFHYFFRPKESQSLSEQERQSLHQSQAEKQSPKAISASQTVKPRKK